VLIHHASPPTGVPLKGSSVQSVKGVSAAHPNHPNIRPIFATPLIPNHLPIGKLIPVTLALPEKCLFVFWDIRGTYPRPLPHHSLTPWVGVARPFSTIR
ncbi:MAG: hypothetical protein ACSW8C_05350, partial [bacterium]